jgi:hypothetical protein
VSLSSNEQRYRHIEKEFRRLILLKQQQTVDKMLVMIRQATSVIENKITEKLQRKERIETSRAARGAGENRRESRETGSRDRRMKDC